MDPLTTAWRHVLHTTYESGLHRFLLCLNHSTARISTIAVSKRAKPPEGTGQNIFLMQTQRSQLHHRLDAKLSYFASQILPPRPPPLAPH